MRISNDKLMIALANEGMLLKELAQKAGITMEALRNIRKGNPICEIYGFFAVIGNKNNRTFFLLPDFLQLSFHHVASLSIQVPEGLIH